MTNSNHLSPSPSPTHSASRTKLAYVSLEDMEVDMEIGVEPQEHGRIQRLIIDVEVGFDDARTRIPDSKEGLLEGFDYAKVRECVKQATHSKTSLIETIANRIADGVLALPGALTCAVKISKKRCWAEVDKTSVRIFREA